MKYFNGLTTADASVLTLFALKEAHFQNYSWWLVFLPWIIVFGVALLATVALGFIKTFSD